MSTYERRAEAWSEISGWRYALLPLAVRRTVRLWRSAGVPTPMVRRPSPLLCVSRQLLLARPVPMPGRRADDLADRSTLLIEAQTELAQVYGTETAGDLRAWVVRHWLDHPEVTRWSIWARVLRVVLGPHRRDTVRLDLSDSATKTLRATAGWHYSNRREHQLNQDEAAARDGALSTVERQILLYDPQTFEPGMPDMVDEVDQMLVTIGRERAYRAVNDLRAAADPQTWDAIASELQRVALELGEGEERARVLLDR